MSLRNKFKLMIWSNAVALVLSVVAIILSGTALCRMCPRENLEFDYLGTLIGIITFATTLLIGYQIYNVVMLDKWKKEIQKEVDKTESKTLKTVNKAIKDYHKVVECLTLTTLNQSDKGSSEMLAFSNYFYTLESGLNAPKDFIDSIIQYPLHYLIQLVKQGNAHGTLIKLDDGMVRRCINTLEKVPDRYNEEVKLIRKFIFDHRE